MKNFPVILVLFLAIGLAIASHFRGEKKILPTQTVVQVGEPIVVVDTQPIEDPVGEVLVGEDGPIVIEGSAPSWSIGQAIEWSGVDPVPGPIALAAFPGDPEKMLLFVSRQASEKREKDKKLRAN